MTSKPDYYGITKRGAAPIALALLAFLAAFQCAPAAHGAQEPTTKNTDSGTCIVDPHYNAGNVDCGVAVDRKKSPFYPSRATTTVEGGYLGIDMFDTPETCQGCHQEIYNQWKGSMHSNAWNDPIYLALMRAASKATKGLTDNLCIGCHTPIGLLTGESSPGGEKLSSLSKNGVQCDFCHNISAITGIGNNSFVLTPRKYGRSLKFGPFKDANSPYHDTTYSDLHTRSELCGTCHNVTHPQNRIPLERTYDEWKDSPYPGEGIGCQECHMSPGPGFRKNPGRAAVGAKEREHIFTHYFVGGNTMVTSMLGAEKHSGLAREMLQSAARMEIISVKNVRPAAVATMVLRVHNSGAGHKLPTGYPEGREMWVDFSVLDGKGKELFRLGRIDGEGRLEEGTRNFKVVLGDAAGNIVDVEVWNATRILQDNRILPRGYADVRFDVPIPPGSEGKLTIKADLCYRSFSQAFVDHLLGKNAPKVPTVIMTSITGQAEVAR
ncbi:MAG TPA: cytochrome c family protein [Dongiaceae bacterium]|nr:cytochrome c family protein [Dongiaceae bacterium]